jgi:hypothetical protein
MIAKKTVADNQEGLESPQPLVAEKKRRGGIRQRNESKRAISCAFNGYYPAGRRNGHFSGMWRVDITVWKTLWRMCKTLKYEQVMKVTARL